MNELFTLEHRATMLRINSEHARTRITTPTKALHFEWNGGVPCTKLEIISWARTGWSLGTICPAPTTTACVRLACVLTNPATPLFLWSQSMSIDQVCRSAEKNSCAKGHNCANDEWFNQASVAATPSRRSIWPVYNRTLCPASRIGGSK